MSDSAGKPALKKGWYVDGEDRTRDKFWNGQAFTKTRKTKDPERAPKKAPREGRAFLSTPGDCFGIAFLIAVLGAIVGIAASDGDKLLVIWLFGSLVGLFTSIGTVAKGVQIGIRTARDM